MAERATAARPSVIYLDVDDEITSAAARIRAVDARRIAVVVPPGSRIATSRINFRLLAREAMGQGRRLAIVAPDAPSRALAASAGLPVFGSVGEFESAAEADARPATSGTDRGAGEAGAAAGAASTDSSTEASAPASRGRVVDRPADEGTVIIPPVPGEGLSPGTAATAVLAPPAETPARRAAPPVAERGLRGRPRALGLLPFVAAAVVLLLVAGGVAAYVLLPSATVVVTPRYEPVGPVSFTVRADPGATAVDAANGVIPATRLSFDLSATDTFRATGQRVDEKAASGTVRWTNCDPTASYRIPAGAVVRTRSGVRFATTESVFLPVAGVSGSPPDVTVNCQSNNSGVQAVEPGKDGNVDANAITVPPSNYNANVIRVTNPQPTTGGTHDVFPKVTKADVDAAQASLRKQLSTQLDAKLGEPDAAPAGTTLFPATKKLSAPEPDVDPASLVNQEVATFDLTLAATGTVVAVDETPLDAIAAQRLTGSVRGDRTLVPGSIETTAGKPDVSGEIVSFPVRASARQVATLDAAALRAAIRGRSVDDARRTLEAYGDVEISTWPGWVSAIPTIDQRLELTIGEPQPLASPGPTGSARPAAASGTPAPSGS